MKNQLHILSEIAADPVKRPRLRELIQKSIISKNKIDRCRNELIGLRRCAVNDLRISPKDFNELVREVLFEVR